MSRRFARPELDAVPPAVHGSLDAAEVRREGLDEARMLDFSVNGNPFGPSPRVLEALRTVRWDVYPDRECAELRRMLAERLDVPMERIVAGNGAAELIHLAAAAFVDRGDRALVVGPTFGEYERAVRLRGGAVEAWRAAVEDGFAVDPGALDREIARIGPRLLFLCNPNNPTGAVVESGAVTDLARRHAETLFLVDEAYLPFVEGMRSAAAAGCPNLLVLRSMTKDCALAGLRLGYAVGPRDLIEALERVRPPWNVNAAAQAAGAAALADTKWLSASLRKLHEARDALWKGLEAAGLPPVPSRTHYALFRVGDGAVFRRRHMDAHVLVRDCASFGLPEFVRIASRTAEDNARLLEAVRLVQADPSAAAG